MTDEEFAKSIGATPVSQSDDDFAKSIGAVPIKASKSTLPPGVPWKSDNLQTTPSSFFKDALPGPVMQAGDENSSFWQKLKDADQAAGQMSQQFISSLVSPINGLVEDITGPNFVGNRIRQVEENQKHLTPQAQAYNQNLNNAMNVMDPGQIGHGHMEFPAREGIKGREALPVVVPKPEVTAADLGAVRILDPLANQSDLGGGAGAFDNIRRQTAGTIPEGPQDITNTPMERMTDTLLNGRDQAATLGAAGPDAYIETLRQRAVEAQQAHEAAVRQAQAQAALEARQTALEQAVRQQTSLDMNAAERTRQEAAPVLGKDASEAQARFQPMVDDLMSKEAEPQVPNPVTPVDPMTSAMHNLEPAQRDSRAMAEATRGITYENVPPDGVIPRDAPKSGVTVPRGNTWHVDENGIPVRQGLPTSEPDLSTATTVHGILSQDEGARNDLGNAIQEANGPKLGPDEHFGAGPIDTVSPTFNKAVLDNGIRRRGVRGNQRGSIQIGGEDLIKAINATRDLMEKAVQSFHEMAAKPMRSIIGMLPEDHMARVSGEDMVYKPEPGQKFADKAVAEGPKNTNIWKNFQSGPLHTAEKPGVNSNALRGVGSWLQWADKRTHLDNRERVNPVQGKINNLNEREMTALWQHMTDEQRSNVRKDPSALSPKAQEAYKALRSEFDRSYNQTVAQAKAQGKEVPKREEAYHASMRQGDFTQSFFNKSGQLIGHVASTSRLEALKAEAWFKKNNPNIDWQKSQVKFAPDYKGVNVPRDILGAYQEMLKFFDGNDPTITLVQDTLARYQQEHGFSSRGFDKRLMDKNNVPGFEGDKPWLSSKENAKSFFNSQLKYLRDANHWNNFQEAMHQIEPIMKNDELVKNQPDIMNYAKSLVQRELGISSNVLDKIETEWARNWPKVGFVDGKLQVKQGISRGNVYKGVADLKTGTYLTMLGANIPYMITTPIQAALSIPRHMLLSSQGITHNPLKTVVNSMGDIGAGLARHMMSGMTGKDVNIPISDVGKRMLHYAENNGILDKTVLDETGNVGGHAATELLKKTIGTTITAPEKLARYSTFVSFAHHLMDSGKFTEADAFQAAERLTNDSLTSMRRLDKPLLVDKFGATGQLGYVFKSYLFNYYNQMAEFAGHAKRGNVAPLAAFVGGSFLLGGALSLPGVNEMDGFYNIFKNIVASKFPQFYHDDLGIKGTLLKDLPTWASMGALSEASGTNIGSRFNTQITNPENPLGDIAVPIQELREASTALDWAADPTERHALGFAHANVGSTIKGQMETRLDSFKNKNPETPDGRDENGRMSYRKANDINNTSTDYKRTQDEEAKRALGFYSQDEYKTKQLRYINNTEQSRTMDAFTNLMNKALTKGVDGNSEAAGKLASAALRLVPDVNRFTKMIDEAALAHGATPEERMAMKADAINNLEKLRRLQSGVPAN
jgi:hypothetical protein